MRQVVCNNLITTADINAVFDMQESITVGNKKINFFCAGRLTMPQITKVIRIYPSETTR